MDKPVRKIKPPFAKRVAEKTGIYTVPEGIIKELLT